MKGWIAHFLIGCVFGLFGWWGVIIALAFFSGAELTQAMYRSFSDGYKWNDLYRKPWIVFGYLPAKRGGWVDTLLDLTSAIAGAVLTAFLREALL